MKRLFVILCLFGITLPVTTTSLTASLPRERSAETFCTGLFGTCDIPPTASGLYRGN